MDLSIIDKKSEFLEKFKQKYNERVDYIDPGHEQNIFSWKNNKLHFTIILTHYTSSPRLQQIIVFAELTENSENSLTYIDLLKETSVFDYDQIYSPDERLQYLIKHNLIKNPEFIKGSLLSQTTINYQISDDDIGFIAEKFADNEYNLAKKELEKNLLSTTKLTPSNIRYFTDRYHFDTIMDSISDTQFSEELKDCIKAYELGLWFVCSTGIGSVIEHILYLTIDNFNEKFDSKKSGGRPPLSYLGKDPTRVDYFNALKQCLPRFDDRQRRQLEAMFLLRNSVDHFNSGYSNKGFCDTLLQGVVDTYNGIYLQSL